MNNVDSSQQIKYGAIISYATVIFNIIAGLVYTPWMIQQIGSSDYGLFILANTFLTYFVMDFGLGNAIARYISRYRAEGNEDKVNDLLGMAIKVYLIIDFVILIVLVVIFIFIQDIFGKLAENELIKFRVVYCIVGLFSIISLPALSLNGILIAYEKFILLKVCDLLNKIFTIIAIVIILLSGFKLYGLVIVNTLVGMGMIIIKMIYLPALTKINFRYKSYSLLKEILGFSFWITVIGVAQRLLMNITPAILGIFSGTSQIAIFAIGMTIEAYIWTIASSLNGLFLPRVSKMAISNYKSEEINYLMIKVGRIQLIIFGAIIGGLIAFGQSFIVFWVGNDYFNSYYVALLLVLPGIVTLTQEIGLTLLLVVNELKYRAILFISASIISLTISVILAPKYGAIGSAFAICIALLVCHILGMNIIYYRVVKLNVLQFFRECHLKLLFPIGLTFILGILIQNSYMSSNMTNFFPKLIAFGIVYCIIIWALGLNKEERSLIRSIIRNAIPYNKIA